jgi:hypothetical protein
MSQDYTRDLAEYHLRELRGALAQVYPGVRFALVAWDNEDESLLRDPFYLRLLNELGGDRTVN